MNHEININNSIENETSRIPEGSKVVVGLSGGVDSSVTAKLLMDKGYTVIGVTIVMCEFNDGGVSDAKEVAKALNIEHHVIDARDVFKQGIMDYFCNEYYEGRTPNPCIRCNELIKWAKMLEVADSIGAQYIATGHYAKILRLPDGRYSVANSATATKDQTYVLYRLGQDMLQRTIMPLGDYDKETVRNMASEADLPVAAKKDSQDICFIPDKDYAAFLSRNFDENKLPGRGNFLDEQGNIIGTHKGYTHYTIGQRKGLEIAAGHRVFVKEIRPASNEVVISDEDVFSINLSANDIHFMGMEEDGNAEFRGFAKIRYAHKGQWCNIRTVNDGTDKRIDITFDEPVRAVTPGQAVVIYNDDSDDKYILMGGTII